MTTRKRSGSGSKRPKEKVVYIYELIFRGEEPWTNNTEFWNEFFLLQPNVDILEGELMKLTSEQFLTLKGNIHKLFTQSIELLESDHPKRVHNCLQTLCALLYAIFRKSSSGESFDIVGTMVGFSDAEENMRKLLGHCNNLLISE